MKKVFFLIASVCLATNAMAQQKISWEAQAGIGSTSLSSDAGSLVQPKIGFQLGVRATKDIPSIAQGVYGNAGAFIASKGATFDIGIVKADITAYYLEIPVHLGYKKAVNEQFTLFGEAGPYLGYGIVGKAHSQSISFNGGTITDNEDVFKTKDRITYGLGLRCGAEFKQKYTASVGYAFSKDINSLILTIGYKF